MEQGERMKTCTKCGAEKSLDAFGPNKQSKDGLRHACRACTQRAWRDWRNRNLEKQRARERDWARSNYPKYAARRAERQRERRAERPERLEANIAIQRQLERGAMVRPDHCEDCGRESLIQAHHPDYSKPLDVEWLCSGCHGRRHAAQGEIA